jgi:hypothetical protein
MKELLRRGKLYSHANYIQKVFAKQITHSLDFANFYIIMPFVERFIFKNAKPAIPVEKPRERERPLVPNPMEPRIPVPAEPRPAPSPKPPVEVPRPAVPA